MAKQFRIRIWIEDILSTDELWPDKDGPVNPTVDDVAHLLEEHGKNEVINEWNLTTGCCVRDLGTGEHIDVDLF